MNPEFCPHCGAPLKLVPLVFGYPTDETFERARRGQVALGGCLVGDDEPAWACSICQEPVSTLAVDASATRG